MSHSSSAVVSKIRQEAALFDSKDRLLNFSSKGDYQTPLVLEAGDLFYEKWAKSKDPIPLDIFLPTSNNLTTQQKMNLQDQLITVLREKSEDFGCSDLYLVLGFLKWDGNALAPVLMVPVTVDPIKLTISLSEKAPIENVILRERLADSIAIPTVEEATVDGQFSILLYFSLFEKAVNKERNWKFTRHGICLAFFNTNRLLLKKNFERPLWDKKKIDNVPFFNCLLGEEGFNVHESVFEDKAFDQVFNPTEHGFLYQTDSSTAKAVMDALDEENMAFAVQTPPGTAKHKVAANIAAESVIQGKRVLVVSRREISKQNFLNAWEPPFRNFSGPEKDALKPEIQKNRDAFEAYFKAVKSNVMPADISLSELLTEFTQSPSTKAKIPEATFQGLASMDYQRYKDLKALVQEISSIYFEKDGINARRSFMDIRVPDLSEEEQKELAADLKSAADIVQELKPLIESLDSVGLFPSGIYISALVETLDLIRNNFNSETPDLENWELRSSNWNAYQTSLLKLPEAGDNWVRYRRQTSDIYTDSAVDENIYSVRDEFAESLKITLKGLSDRYRGTRKTLLRVFKDPKSITSDAQLLDLIDTLLELQENKRAYKDTAVLGSHLLGKDWLYEKSNWFELNKKIRFVYAFREKHQGHPRLDMLLQILEHWHQLRSMDGKYNDFYESVKTLQESIRKISKKLELEVPLESLSLEKWLGTITAWNENWGSLNLHLQLSKLFQQLDEFNCPSLKEYLQDISHIHKDILNSVAHHWAGSQIQTLAQSVPDLFSLTPKARAQKGKDYCKLLDQWCNANFRAVHAAKDLMKFVTLSESLEMSVDQDFDITIFLDADCTTIVDAMPSLAVSNKVILIGDPQAPSIELQPFDAYQNTLPRHTAFFQENILAASLRRGISSRVLTLSNMYADVSLIEFANEKIYNNTIVQFPKPSRERYKGPSLKVVPDKILAVAKAAIHHAEKRPGQTLGIIAFHQARCQEIEIAIKSLITKDSPAARFFAQANPMIRYYIKTPERAVDKYRDTILVCAEPEGASGINGERKLSACTTLAKQELQVFVSDVDFAKQSSSKTNLFWDWMNYLQGKLSFTKKEATCNQSILTPKIVEALEAENIKVEKSFCNFGIPVGPVVVDANNFRRFLALIDDDCTEDPMRESLDDRLYIRLPALKQLGWKVLQMWLPFWYMANKDEVGHLQTTIAIEQSVAPPPPEEGEQEASADDEAESAALVIQPYQVLNPKIEGTPHDKPIAELQAVTLITELKFYVDHEAPIHEELLFQRVLDLHKVDRMGPNLKSTLTEAVKLGLQNKRYIKTGPFFYSIKSPEIALRDRSTRPDAERKFVYVAPEERALLPASMDDHSIKQTLGLLE